MPIKRRVVTSELQEIAAAEPKPLRPVIDPRGDTDFERVLGYHVYGGMEPKEIPAADLQSMVRQADWPDNVENAYRERIRNRGTAIRAFCVTCTGGLTAEVRDCPEFVCPLWSFRMGGDPYRKR